MTSPKSGVVVILQQPVNGTLTEITRGTTNANGIVTFANIPVGIYAVRVETPAGYAIVDNNENIIVDSNNSNNEIKQVNFGAGFNYGALLGIDVSKNATAYGTAVISQGIFVDFILKWTLGINLKFKIKTSSAVAQALAISMHWDLNRDDGDGNMVSRAAGGDHVLTIAQGQMISNEVVISTGFTANGFGTVPGAGDVFEFYLGTNPPKPANVVIETSSIELNTNNQL
jgi:hypothetical protein